MDFRLGTLALLIPTWGQFDVLFNICKNSDNTLHGRRGVPENFHPILLRGEVKSSDSAISPGPIHSHGIQQILQPSKPRLADYEFQVDSSTSAGAILILPHGAISKELLSPQQFREVASGSALDWYEFARKCYGVEHLDYPLYLITGFYKARSWSLGSFNNPTGVTGKILAQSNVEKNPNIYLLTSEFPADRRHGGGDDNNQAVFISGFKITVKRWLPDPMVQMATESETTWFILLHLLKACLNRLRSLSGAHKQRAAISVEHSPQLSQPFHPSDIINHFLLSKNPNARVAVTHDNQWMDMMKKGLTHEDLLQDDRLGAFLTRCYTISVDSECENTAVFLRGGVDGTMDSDSPPHDPLSEPEMLEPPDSKSEISSPPASELAISPSTTSELEVSSLPTPPPDNPWLVITRVRAQNITSGLKRIPAGFYVLIQFNGSQRRTQNKSIRLNDSGLEWEDKILLPSNVYDKVRFMVYASFELEPMLGNGEALYTSERHVGELVGGTHLITFPATPDPSLLITLGRWYSNRLVVAGGNDSNLDSEEPSVLVRETELGQEALLRYYNEYQREDLKNATQHFEDALRHCPSKHQCRAAVLVNLAKAKFISYQIDPTSANLDESILPYREALDLRRPGHLDRLATLLQLAQTLLSRYEKQGCDESVADQITKLMSECLDCPEDSHERRAADLVLETLERCTVVNSGNLVELDKLAQKLKKSALVLPDNYFDRPQRLINLSTTLRKCYEKYGKLGDLECLLEINKQASQLLPAHHPDRLPGLRALDAALWRPSEIRGDLSYLREVIVTSEDALRLIPEGHPERRYWITNSASCLSEMSERLGDKAFEARKYDEAIAQYSQAIVLRSTPS